MDTATLLQTNCRYCNTPSKLKFSTRDFNRKVSAESFDYFQCPSCNLVFLHPIPKNLSDFYPKEYHAVPSSVEELDDRTKIDRYKIEIVRQFVDKGRLLEIGPSIGGFSYLAKKSGFEVEAIEMDKDCCKYLEDVLKIKTINTHDIDSALKKSIPYNVIAMWHVIEHLPDPWESLNVISQKLAPGGILILSAPNPQALQFRFLKQFWAHVDAPRHLELIPSRLLTEFLSKRGMSTVLTTTQDEGSTHLNSFGWATSLGYFFKNPSLKRGMRGIGRVINALLKPFENKNGAGSTYTMVFKKLI